MENNQYSQNSYKDYLKSIENKIYISTLTNKNGENYIGYSLRHINKSSTPGLEENSMVVISMNHTKIYNPGSANNVVLNIIPMSQLKNCTFKLEDYRYPNKENIVIEASNDAPYIQTQYENRPIKNINTGFRTITNNVNNNIYNNYKDLMQNSYSVIKYESHMEVYCRDITNPNLVIMSQIDNSYSGRISFTRLLDFDMNSNLYVYYQPNTQNKLEFSKSFDLDDYNKQVIKYFGNNLNWSIG